MDSVHANVVNVSTFIHRTKQCEGEMHTSQIAVQKQALISGVHHKDAGRVKNDQHYASCAKVGQHSSGPTWRGGAAPMPLGRGGRGLRGRGAPTLQWKEGKPLTPLCVTAISRRNKKGQNRGREYRAKGGGRADRGDRGTDYGDLDWRMPNLPLPAPTWP